MTEQFELFETQTQATQPTASKPARCGKCRFMDTSLPGCYPIHKRYDGELSGLGRCTNPESTRSYWLAPQHTRADSPAGPPPNGSWHCVAYESIACEFGERGDPK